MTTLIKISVTTVPNRADRKKGACAPTDIDIVIDTEGRNNVNQEGGYCMK